MGATIEGEGASDEAGATGLVAATGARGAAGSGGTFSQLEPNDRRAQNAIAVVRRGAQLRSITAASYHQ